jgi:MoaA/NifB/PqqE/SkfB family radical SAM enzyme
MPDKRYFCNTPWYELHVYQDGSLGICCQEDHKLYGDKQTWNIATTSIKDWFNSEPVRKFRKQVLGKRAVSACRQCYKEEQVQGYSRRMRSNQKSVIFTRTAFDQSYVQSPGRQHFELSESQQGLTDTLPIDLHIDLGNHCNLACKMCSASASSTIAVQEVKWGIESSRRFVGSDWTQDDVVWNNFIQQILEIDGLKNIHFMGGETLLTNRFEQFVDGMIRARRFDLCMSFVTNGTVFKPKLMKKLTRFQRVGIEVSMETVTDHNAYQRQGTQTNQVIKNIQQYQEFCNGTTITVSLRPAPSALTIGYHVTLLKFALVNKLLIKSNLVYEPKFLDASILPTDVKRMYAAKYLQFLLDAPNVDTSTDYNFSDPNNHVQVIRQQAEMCLSILQTPAPKDQDQLLEQMIRHCERWDRIYDLDARLLYPEFKDIFRIHGYNLS